MIKGIRKGGGDTYFSYKELIQDLAILIFQIFSFSLCRTIFWILPLQVSTVYTVNYKIALLVELFTNQVHIKSIT